VDRLRQTLKFFGSDGWTTRTWVALTAALFTVAGAVVALAVATEDVTQHNGLSTSDPSHLKFFVDHRGDQLVNLAKVVTEAGAAPLLAVLALVAAVVLWWRGAPVIVAVAPAIALGVGGSVAAVAKQVVGRARPPAGVRLLSETEPSFPSGHATDSAAFYLTLALIVAVFVLRRPLLRVATVAAGAAVVGCIGTSRLVLGVHWPTDVLAGWALGTIVSLVVVLAVAGLNRVTRPSSEGARWRLRVMLLLNARRSSDLRAV
jgi:undecaprenyl-diphosphatase